MAIASFAASAAAVSAAPVIIRDLQLKLRVEGNSIFCPGVVKYHQGLCLIASFASQRACFS